jgi:putative ABC transport system permease protein
LRKSPAFTIIAVFAIGLGVGANTAIFSVVNAVLLRPLPYKNPDRLVAVLHDKGAPVAPANYLDWRAQNHVFEDMGAAESWTVNLSGGEQAESVTGMLVTQNLFPMLGVQPLLGRFFLPDEEARGKDHAVLLSFGLWQRRFGGDPGIVGQTVLLQGEKYTVVGVMPTSFKFAPFWETKAELWAPLSLTDRASSRAGNSLRTFARLRPGVSLNEARSEMTTIAARLEKQFPGTNREVRVDLVKEEAVGYVRPALLVLLAAVSFVLLIACANVAHMLLARGSARQKEVAIRAAMGAERWRIVRQFFTESLLLAVFGAAAGLTLAFWGIRLLRALSPASLPRVENVGLDWKVLLFTGAIALLTGIIVGVAPAWQASAVHLRDALQDSGRGSGESARRNRLRNVLVGSEFALAVVLLVGAGLMIRTFAALYAIDPGFNPHHVLSAVVSVAGTSKADPARRSEFYQQLLQRVRTLPGVESASAINHAPLVGDVWGFPFSIAGRPLPSAGESPRAIYRVILPNYFHTMNISLIKGRDITAGDKANTPDVVVINNRMARLYWPGQDPIGKRITFDNPAKNPAWVTVVGVVRDAKQDDWSAVPRPEMYLSLLQSVDYLKSPSSHMQYITLVARTTTDPVTLAANLKTAVASIDKNIPVSNIVTMDQAVEESNAQPRFEVDLLSSFAGVALILAAIGIYGVMSYSVSRRMHELGVRMALGADQADVIGLIVKQAMKLALAGSGCGLLAAYLLTRLMSRLLYGVGSADPLTFIASALVACGAALSASYLPARRATRIDPVTALRYE